MVTLRKIRILQYPFITWGETTTQGNRRRLPYKDLLVGCFSHFLHVFPDFFIRKTTVPNPCTQDILIFLARVSFFSRGRRDFPLHFSEGDTADRCFRLTAGARDLLAALARRLLHAPELSIHTWPSSRTWPSGGVSVVHHTPVG